MSRLSIVIAPEPVLKRSAEPVERVDDRVRRLMDDMLETMRAANGIGLAAPQVGDLRRIIVVDVSLPEDEPRPYRMANPELVWRSEETATGEEGCLSLPDHYADVTRPARIRVRYRDEDDTPQELEADGILARCIQHEMDHLEGILFVDHISSIRRDMILRKLSKTKKQQVSAAE